jgi:hypothetical protein
LCCKLIPVEELAKAAGVRCQHVRTGKGCSIYEHRPTGCREWSCLWLIGTDEGHELRLGRPDRTHYVLDMVPDIIRITNNVTGAVTQLDVMQIWCDPKFPDAWSDPALLAMLDRQGVIGLVRFNSEKGFAIFPPSRSASGKWERGIADSVEGLRDAQREARFAFWRKAG